VGGVLVSSVVSVELLVMGVGTDSVVPVEGSFLLCGRVEVPLKTFPFHKNSRYLGLKFF